jgi:hypothetical protein
MIPYNDCFFRNMYRYEYIAMIDMDEVIMPLSKDDWAGMMTELDEASRRVADGPWASFSFRNVYFLEDTSSDKRPKFDDVPAHMHMMNHVRRSANYTRFGIYDKSLFSTDEVVLTHNHMPLVCLGGPCKIFQVPTAVAHVQHYRDGCRPELMKVCDHQYKSSLVEDKSLWRYKEEVVAGTTETLVELGLLSES